MREVIVLRPQPGADATAARAAELGLTARVLPLFAIEPVAWQPPEASDHDALLLTSANALRHGGTGLEPLRALPVLAVGEATAEAARCAGFTVIATGTADAAALLASIDPPQRLLHLGGQEMAEAKGKHWVERRHLYRAVALPDPGLDVALGQVVLVHSPRAGTRLAELVSERGATAIAAISTAAARACGGGWERIECIDTPTDAALLALAARLCQDCGR